KEAYVVLINEDGHVLATLSAGTIKTSEKQGNGYVVVIGKYANIVGKIQRTKVDEMIKNSNDEQNFAFVKNLKDEVIARIDKQSFQNSNHLRYRLISFNIVSVCDYETDKILIATNHCIQILN